MRIISVSINGTYMRCVKIKARNSILDVQVSKECWKRFCDNQRNLTSSLGIFPLGLNRHTGRLLIWHKNIVGLSILVPPL